MAWTSYSITGYETALLAYNTPGYPDTFAWINKEGNRYSLVFLVDIRYRIDVGKGISFTAQRFCNGF